MLKRPSRISGGHILQAALTVLTQGRPCPPGTLSSRLTQAGQPGAGGALGGTGEPWGRQPGLVCRPSDEELPLVLVEPGDEGQRHQLQVRTSTSVTQVKEMIKRNTAIPPNKQIVNYNGKKLEDGMIMEIMASKRAIYSSWHTPALVGDHPADGVIGEAKDLGRTGDEFWNMSKLLISSF